MNGSRSVWRRIEQALAGELPAAARRRLMVSLRGDPVARGQYDAAVDALRLLEHEPDVAAFELDLVERWVIEDLEPSPTTSAARGWWSQLGLGFAVAAAVLLVVVLRPRAPIDDGGGFGVRDLGEDARLSIQALCGPTGADRPLRPDTCAADDVLGFAYRVQPGTPGRVLTLFGVDADGDPMFYAPTPNDETAIEVMTGRWQAVDMGVELSVNHAEGDLDVYAVLAPTEATVEQVRGWAERLAAASAGPSDRPWPQRIGDPTLSGLCVTSDACEVAQLRLSIGSASR